jgi:photosystem II stability/assembly factor-like uncharacterized protein
LQQVQPASAVHRTAPTCNHPATHPYPPASRPPRSFRDKDRAFAVGGSGSLYKSEDGGRTWKRDKGGDDVPANLYAVRFFNNGANGFILGNDAILLRYIGA